MASGLNEVTCLFPIAAGLFPIAAGPFPIAAGPFYDLGRCSAAGEIDAAGRRAEAAVGVRSGCI